MTGYRYDLVLYREDGAPLREAPFEADWEPAIEWARFAALRSGRLPAAPSDEKITTAPLWDEEAGEPFVSGFVVRVASNGVLASSEFPIAYFRDAASRASARLVEEGALKKGDRFLYRARAIRSRGRAGAAPAKKLRAVERRTPFPATESSLSAFAENAAIPDEPVEGDFPVFVHEGVLSEAILLSVRAGDAEIETAGMLVGRLHVDRRAPEAFVEITDQFPARHTAEEMHRLVFTPETWSDVHETLDTRFRGKVLVGWYHSHPVRAWCRECGEEKRDACPYARGFFSEQDRLVHRAAFPAGFHVAMVVTDAGEPNPDLSFFGWRRGMIEKRGVRVTAAVPRGCGSPREARKPREEP